MNEPKKRQQTLPDPEQRAASPSPDTLSTSEQGSSVTKAPFEEGADTDDLSFLSPPQDPRELGRLNGYRIVRKLGEGGMGLVFEAEDIRLERRVALKIMRPEIAIRSTNRARFLREAKAAAAVEHVNIVPIYQVGEENGVPFIAMPFLKGEPLDVRLRRSHLEVSEILTIGWQTARGLAAAHERGLVHRDIKPANIWLSVDPDRHLDVKILDFGLARQAHDEVKLTGSGAILGTPAYMAPEQANGEQVDQRADLFSFGAMLYEMATGELPFKGKTFAAIIVSLNQDTPPEALTLNAQLPPALSRLIATLLEKDPAKRPKSTSEVVEEFRQILQSNTAALVSASQRKIDAADRAENKLGTSDLDSDRRDVESRERNAGAREITTYLAEHKSEQTTPRKAAASRRTNAKPTRWVLVGLATVCIGAVAVYLALTRNNTSTSGGVFETGRENKESVDGKKDAPKNSLLGAAPYEKGDEISFDLANGVKLELININAKGKTFLMGSPKDEADRKDNEDQHAIIFSHDWYMGKCEVTQEQYEAIMGKNPSKFKGVKNPVEMVSWNDAQDFIKKLNVRLKDKKFKFRLPSEAEWEYSCRAGTTSPYCFGTTLTSAQASIDRSSNQGTKPVGSFPANAFGLYDMHGNVCEWCEDCDGPYSKAPTDGSAQLLIQSLDFRILRGGDWYGFDKACRSASRNSYAPEIVSERYGFRVVASRDEPMGDSKDNAPIPPIVKGEELTFELSRSVKLEIIKINAKGKRFLMGSPVNELGRNIDEEQHEVIFGHDWYLGKYEVTQDQFEAIVGKNPANYKGPQSPVERVSWEDAEVFLKKLNDRFKSQKINFRFPSEAEWEYSCRAGTTTPFHFGNELNGTQANCDGTNPYGTNEIGRYLKKTVSVGANAPNAFGLYDMHGNVRELCDDYYGPYSAAPKDGTSQRIKQATDVRVMRGGSWYDSGQACRAATRHSYTPDNGGVGFRVAASLD